MAPFVSFRSPGAVLALMIGGTVAAAAQTGRIEGRVSTGVTGEPIVRAEVTVVGTTIGTLTDDAGRYVLLNVPVGTRQVRTRAIGFASQTVRVAVEEGQTAAADVALTASALELDALVVTGTAGETRRREVGNSIAAIDLAREVKDPPASIDQLLQGREAGVNVMQGNGSAGGGAQIRLRGVVSVSQSNQPIIYVDGIRVRSEGYARNAPAAGSDFTGRSANIQSSPINDINPADIERVEIIKGAAASTLYGTEASAGVIQIFTKKGRGTQARWSFQMDQGFARLMPFGTEWNPYVNFTPGDSMTLSGTELTTFRERESAGYCPDLVAQAREEFRDTGVFPTVQPCDWIRLGHRQKYAGSVTGGLGAFNYFMSGSWDDLDGVMSQDNEQKLVTRGNFSVDLSDKVRLEWNSMYSNYNLRNTPSGNNAQGLTLNVFRAERNYRSSSNPVVLDSLLNQSITTEVDRLITGSSVYFTPIPTFTHRFTIGLDLATQENRNLRPFGFVGTPLGVLFDEQNKYTTLTADYVGNLDFGLGEQLSSTLSFGGQSVTTEEVSTHAFGRDFPGPGEPTVSNAAVFISRESRIRVVNAGFFVQNIFKLRDRYFVTAGLRLDGNSAFGRDFGIQAYPKASVSYVVSDEAFWPAGWGEVKLRAAVGLAGRAPGAFASLRTWEAAASSGQSAFLPDNVGNANLGPERTREIELGFDAAILNNRIAAEFTWYHSITSDALFPVRQIPSLGFQESQLANVGKIRNAGIEATISASVFNGINWGLDLGTTVFTNHSLVVDLGGAPPFAAGGGWVEEGFPVMAAKGVRVRNPDALAAPDTACVERCASDGEYVFGPQQPTFTWGLSATLRLPRNLILSARGEYQGGAWIYDNASSQALQRSVRWPTCRRAHLLDDAGMTNQITAREQLECLQPVETDIYWYPQDFFKLRDVTLTVPLGSILPQASAATLSLTAQNWVRWINSDLRMFDPEMTARDNLNEQNREISEHVPPPAIFTASLRVQF